MTPPDPTRIRFEARGGAGGPGILKSLLGLVVGTVLIVAGFVFSLVFLAVFVAVAIVVGGYLWWKTRAIRRQFQAQMEQAQAQMRAQAERQQAAGASGETGGTVIEGEFRRDPP